jgi:hypothetical protein
MINIQALLIHNLNHRSDPLHRQLRRRHTSQGAIPKEKRSVVGLCELRCFADSERAYSDANRDGRCARRHDCGFSSIAPTVQNGGRVGFECVADLGLCKEWLIFFREGWLFTW